MTRLTLSLLLLFCCSVRAEQVITLATRAGVTQSYLLLFPTYAAPQRAAILFPGGNGVIGLATVNGQATLAVGGNFLVRTRTMMRDANFAVAVMDAPSDRQSAAGMDDVFRASSDHAADVRAVMADMSARFPGTQFYLIGTSRGTVSAAHLGAALGDAVRGVVLTSSITVADSAVQTGLASFDYRTIPSSVLMVSNADDACPSSPYSGTLRASQIYGLALITVHGGLPPTSAVCDPYAYHGYYGKEAETISAIKSWMMGYAYVADIPAALNSGAYSLSPAALGFGSQPVGALAAGKSVTLANTGTSALAIASIVVSIAGTAEFSASDNCGYSLASGASCSIAVAAVPAAVGNRTGSVTINANAAPNPQSVALSANGVSPPAPLLPVAAGWNLAGNGSDAPLSVAATYGDAYRVTSVWKWLAAKSSWAFFSPAYGDNGAAYAASKGYEALSVIDGGEAYWINAKRAFSAQTVAGPAVASTAFQASGGKALGRGWSLIAVGDSPTPAQFNAALVAAAPGQAGGLNALWAWDSARSNWYFWAPSLAGDGGLASFIAARNYLDFTSNSAAPAGTLAPTSGFWVNMP